MKRQRRNGKRTPRFNREKPKSGGKKTKKENVVYGEGERLNLGRKRRRGIPPRPTTQQCIIGKRFKRALPVLKEGGGCIT